MLIIVQQQSPQPSSFASNSMILFIKPDIPNYLVFCLRRRYDCYTCLVGELKRSNWTWSSFERWFQFLSPSISVWLLDVNPVFFIRSIYYNTMCYDLIVKKEVLQDRTENSNCVCVWVINRLNNFVDECYVRK